MQNVIFKICLTILMCLSYFSLWINWNTHKLKKLHETLLFSIEKGKKKYTKKNMQKKNCRLLKMFHLDFSLLLTFFNSYEADVF